MDDTPTPVPRRPFEQKTVWNCERCFPRLCRCEDRHQAGVDKSQGSLTKTFKEMK